MEEQVEISNSCKSYKKIEIYKLEGLNKERSLSSKKQIKIPVRINVYSLESVNQTLGFTGLGIYHSGVEVYNMEWAYGGHPFPMSGIYKMVKPRDLKSLTNIDGVFKFSQALRIGYTNYTLDQIKILLHSLGKEQWMGNDYHLLYKNCNNFSNYLCNILCNHGIPSWINRVAATVSAFPFIVTLIPNSYLTPPALEEVIKEASEVKNAELKSKSNKPKSQEVSIKEEIGCIKSNVAVAYHGNIERDSDSDSSISMTPKKADSSETNIGQTDSDTIDTNLIKTIQQKLLQKNQDNNADEQDDDAVSSLSKSRSVAFKQRRSTSRSHSSSSKLNIQTKQVSSKVQGSSIHSCISSSDSFAERHLSQMYALSQTLSKTKMQISESSYECER